MLPPHLPDCELAGQSGQATDLAPQQGQGSQEAWEGWAVGSRGLWDAGPSSQGPPGPSARTDPERLLGDAVLHTLQHVHVGMWRELRTRSRTGSEHQPQAREIKGPLPGQADNGALVGDCPAPGVDPARTHTLMHRACVHSSGTVTGVGWRAEAAPGHSVRMPEGHGHTLHPPLNPELMPHVSSQLPSRIPPPPASQGARVGRVSASGQVHTHQWMCQHEHRPRQAEDRICSCHSDGPPDAQGGGMARSPP